MLHVLCNFFVRSKLTNKDDVPLLIDFVEGRPCLWNLSDPDNAKREKRVAAFNEIAFHYD